MSRPFAVIGAAAVGLCNHELNTLVVAGSMVITYLLIRLLADPRF